MIGFKPPILSVVLILQGKEGIAKWKNDKRDNPNISPVVTQCDQALVGIIFVRICSSSSSTFLIPTYLVILILWTTLNKDKIVPSLLKCSKVPCKLIIASLIKNVTFILLSFLLFFMVLYLYSSYSSVKSPT